MALPDLSTKNAARLQLAAQCISEGNLAAANVLCWNVLDGQATNADAWNLLGVIAAQLRLRDRAVEFFGRARDSGSAQAAGNLQNAAHDPTLAPPSGAQGERFLLIKAWGAGFWSDVSHVLSGLVLAEATNRTPVVYWGRNSLFGDRTDRDCYTGFFEPVSHVSIDDLKSLRGADFFPPKWNAHNLADEENDKWAGSGAKVDAIYFLARPERVVVADFYISMANFAPLIPVGSKLAQLSISDLFRYAIGKYFRPRQQILEQAKAFFEANLVGGPFVAVHMRGSDKVGEATFTTDAAEFMAHVTRETYKILDRVDPSARIFLMTDDERIVMSSTARYGHRVVMTTSQRTSGQIGLHFLTETDHKRLGVEVMIDVLVALQASAFIGVGGSNVAAIVSLLRDWPERRCILLGNSILLRRGQMPYLDRQYIELERPD